VEAGFSEKDMRREENLEHIPMQRNRDVLYAKAALKYSYALPKN
jgi:hypothetical protein